ncbi:MAG: pyridoxal phosphate-dependent aminotransferase [Chloroflexota bacterium]|jgi:alanine-synthesizing transaminase
MTGFLADADMQLNRIEHHRQQIADYIDITSANPTTQGLLFPADILRNAANDYWDQRRYRPDPRGILAARASIAAYYATRQPALTLDPERDIYITASTSESYALLFALLTNPGDNVLIPDVSYPLFEYLAAMFRIELRPYALDPHRGWRIDPWHLGRISDERTRAVLIVSPHNPTGNVIKKPLPVLEWLDIPIICDEVFAEMPYAIPTVPPLAALMPNLPIFTLNGISKMFALPDLKLGWITMTPTARHAYAERLELLNDTLLGANGLTQHMLPHIMTHGMDFVAHQRQVIQANISAVLAILAHVPRIRVRPPDAGYYLFIEVLDAANEETLVIHLLDHGVLVHPGFFFGSTSGCYIVISCLVQTEQLIRGIERVIRGLDSYPIQ